MLDAFSVHAEGLEAFRTFSNNLPGVDSVHPRNQSRGCATSKGVMYFLNSRTATSG